MTPCLCLADECVVVQIITVPFQQQRQKYDVIIINVFPTVALKALQIESLLFTPFL